MHALAILQMMVLLALANGAPLIAKKICGSRFASPLDFGINFFDRRALFGPSKTLRGVGLAVLAATAGAPLIGLNPVTGAIAGSAAMAGDLLSSFLKRRLNLPSSSQALGLDQIPESLLPMLACRHALSLAAADIALGVGLFFAGELVLSRLLFQAKLRDEPY
jgi:CDP-diglyceride synthetase